MSIDDDLATGTSTVPTGESHAAGVDQLKVDTPVDTGRVTGKHVLEDDIVGLALLATNAKDGDDGDAGVANVIVASIGEDDDDASAASFVSAASSKKQMKARAFFERKMLMVRF